MSLFWRTTEEKIKDIIQKYLVQTSSLIELDNNGNNFISSLSKEGYIVNGMEWDRSDEEEDSEFIKIILVDKNWNTYSVYIEENPTTKFDIKVL